MHVRGSGQESTESETNFRSIHELRMAQRSLACSERRKCDSHCLCLAGFGGSGGWVWSDETNEVISTLALHPWFSCFTWQILLGKE